MIFPEAVRVLICQKRQYLIKLRESFNGNLLNIASDLNLEIFNKLDLPIDTTNIIQHKLFEFLSLNKKSIIEDIDRELSDIDKEVYNLIMLCDDHDIVGEELPALTEIVKLKIRNFNDFSNASLVIANDFDCIYDDLSSCQPLYFYVGQQREKYEPFFNKFSDRIRQSFRIYDDLRKIPNNLITFIIVWNRLHIVSSKLIHNDLNRYFKLLKPGGKILINFPDLYDSDDYDKIVKGKLQPYSSNHIKNIIEKSGFEVIEFMPNGEKIILAKKPGNLRSNKSSRVFTQNINIDNLNKNN